MNSHRFRYGSVAAVCFTYFVVLLSLAGHLSLWLDEVLQLIGTRGTTLAEMMKYIPTNPGATPLGYLTQAVFLNVLGYSLHSARLPSILCSVAACVAVWTLAGNIHRPAQLPALLIFMILPLQFRYALEARPYSEALMLSAFSTVVLFQILKRATVGKLVLYLILVTLGLYAQPFSIFVPLSHIVWVFHQSHIKKGQDWVRVRNALGGATIVAIILFLPWFLWVALSWRSEINVMAPETEGFQITARAPLMILREISGAGWWGSSIFLLAAALGLASPTIEKRLKILLSLLIVIPIAGAFAANALFAYFLAIRQIIFILPALTILAAEGFRHTWASRPKAAVLFATGLLTASLWYDVRWFSRPREDWDAPAKALARATPEACILPAPADTLKLYRFFEPQLENHLCTTAPRRSAVLVLSPYRSANQEKGGYQWLAARGFRRKPGETTIGGTILVRFEADEDE